jgi:hypothetical protein
VGIDEGVGLADVVDGAAQGFVLGACVGVCVCVCVFE